VSQCPTLCPKLLIPLSRYHFFTENQFPFLRPHFFPTCNMADQSRSTRFRALFESALQAYERKTGVILAEHPLALQLQSCCSVESIATLLQDQIRVSSDFRGHDRIIISIMSTLSVISTLSTTTALDWATGLVRQKALMTCSTSLTIFCRHSHPKMQYTPVSLSYLLYVILFSTFILIILTAKSIRRPRASIQVVMRLSTCSSRSNAFLGVSPYIPGSPTQPPWTRWWSR
jgi:hypothetical protein